MTARTEPSERAIDAALQAEVADGIDVISCLVTINEATAEDMIRAAIIAYLATDETIAALRRDAERYRWLRERSGYVQNKSFVIDGVLEEYLDELIDAALRQAETEGGS